MLVLSILPIHMYWSCVYVCVCVLHTYRRVKQLTVKIKSNNRAPLTLTHRPSHSRAHARTLQLTASHAAHLLFSLSLTLSHSSTMKAIELNHCRWQFSAICLVVVVVVGGGHFNRRRRRRRHNKLQRSATHGRAQRSAALLVLAAALASLPFRISHSTSWRSERQRGSVHRLVRRSQLTFSARWNLVADGRVFVSTVPQFHHSASASAASSQAAPQQTLVALRRRRSPISASRKCSLNNS